MTSHIRVLASQAYANVKHRPPYPSFHAGKGRESRPSLSPWEVDGGRGEGLGSQPPAQACPPPTSCLSGLT